MTKQKPKKVDDPRDEVAATPLQGGTDRILDSHSLHAAIRQPMDKIREALSLAAIKRTLESDFAFNEPDSTFIGNMLEVRRTPQPPRPALKFRIARRKDIDLSVLFKGSDPSHFEVVQDPFQPGQKVTQAQIAEKSVEIFSEPLKREDIYELLVTSNSPQWNYRVGLTSEELDPAHIYILMDRYFQEKEKLTEPYLTEFAETLAELGFSHNPQWTIPSVNTLDLYVFKALRPADATVPELSLTLRLGNSMGDLDIVALSSENRFQTWDLKKHLSLHDQTPHALIAQIDGYLKKCQSREVLKPLFSVLEAQLERKGFVRDKREEIAEEKNFETNGVLFFQGAVHHGNRFEIRLVFKDRVTGFHIWELGKNTHVVREQHKWLSGDTAVSSSVLFALIDEFLSEPSDL